MSFLFRDTFLKDQTRAHTQTMEMPSSDMLIGALAAEGKSTHGEQEELFQRLGAALVHKMFKSRKRRCQKAKQPKVYRSRSQWFAFLAAEKHKVKLGRPELDTVGVLRECARRWKLVKIATTSDAPLLLGCADDDLKHAIMELSEAEICASMMASRLPVSEDVAANASMLAEQIYVEI